MKYKVTNITHLHPPYQNRFLTEAGRLLRPGQSCLANRLDKGTWRDADANLISIEEGSFDTEDILADAAVPRIDLPMERPGILATPGSILPKNLEILRDSVTMADKADALIKKAAEAPTGGKATQVSWEELDGEAPPPPAVKVEARVTEVGAETRLPPRQPTEELKDFQKVEARAEIKDFQKAAAKAAAKASTKGAQETKVVAVPDVTPLADSKPTA